MMAVAIVDDDAGALHGQRVGGTSCGAPDASWKEPSIIIPFPRDEQAMVPASPVTTKCFVKPKARHSHSMAAGASRYLKEEMIVEPMFPA